jgi:hypothetical protein
VPRLSPHQVLVNGDKAPYGDIISHFRLEQGKQNRSSGQTKANLKVELAKMGLLKRMKLTKETTPKILTIFSVS